VTIDLSESNTLTIRDAALDVAPLHTELLKVLVPSALPPELRGGLTGRVVVRGINMIKKHQRATQTAEGGIIEREAAIHHSKVMLIDPKTDAPTRIRRRRDADGTVERVGVKSGQSIARSR